MEKIIKIAFAAIFVGIVPITMVEGQEKKSEQKIKIVINDGDETKVLIDTLFTDGLVRDSIRLKNGKYIFIGKSANEHGSMSDGDVNHVFVTVSSDSKNSDTELKEIEIVKSDHSDHLISEKTGNIFVYSGDKVSVIKSEDSDTDMSWTVKDDDGKGEQVIIIKDGSVVKTDGEKTFTYTIKGEKSENKISDSESTKYVIRKDGMVISVEGEDYEKVKKLADEISGKIENKEELSDKKEVKKK